MAASNPSGPKPRPVKTFKFEIGCEDGRASAASKLMYDAVIRKAGGAVSSLRQGRVVLSIAIYKPVEKKGPARGAAKKTTPSRGR